MSAEDAVKTITSLPSMTVADHLVLADALEETGACGASLYHRLMADTVARHKIFDRVLDWAVKEDGVKLVQSRHARTVYDSGRCDEESWDVYSKRYHRNYGPARWRSAGIKLLKNTDESLPPIVRITTARGKTYDYPATEFLTE